jgi:hypothetical protein
MSAEHAVRGDQRGAGAAPTARGVRAVRAAGPLVVRPRHALRIDAGASGVPGPLVAKHRRLVHAGAGSCHPGAAGRRGSRPGRADRHDRRGHQGGARRGAAPVNEGGGRQRPAGPGAHARADAGRAGPKRWRWHSVLPYERLLDIDARLEHAAARPVIVPDTHRDRPRQRVRLGRVSGRLPAPGHLCPARPSGQRRGETSGCITHLSSDPRRILAGAMSPPSRSDANPRPPTRYCRYSSSSLATQVSLPWRAAPGATPASRR